MEKEKKFSGLFSFDGEVTTKEALPLAFQHVVAMIASCITPPIMLAGASGLSPKDTMILIQIALIGSALTTLLMIYPIKIIGSRLPMIFGVSFAYVPTMIGLANQFGARGPVEVVAIVLGAQIVGGICSILFGLGLKYIMPLFPPLVSGTVVLVIGLSLYPVAMNYMGGAGSVEVAGWGAWQNWLVGGITLILGLGFTHFGKGMFKLAN
ncbi:MAG: purine permease, partial [Anaerococcus vaginalis]|uniref:solute carrier family 23 protein n=2 Tax=Peptoniphilaceae TaxID=1570339 RepID=UPI00242F9CC5